MRKLMFLLAILSFMLIITPISTVKASSSIDYESIQVEDEYIVEISREEVNLPLIMLDENWEFTISLYSKDDVDFSNPLLTSGTKYKFEAIGEYVICFTIIDKVSPNRTKTLYSTLNVVDTTSPIIEIEDCGFDNISVGDKLTIPQAYSYDNSGMDNIAYTLKITINGKDVTNTAKDGSIAFQEGGEANFIYTVKDSNNNTTEKIVKIVVSSKSSKTANVLVLAIPLCMTGIGATILYALRRR